MEIIGIIAEYNPFHNGHLYHLNKIKELYPNSLIVLVMSGNFLQRGEVSILDKYEKTLIALQFGIDIVLELPFKFATQSADKFSYGALKILNEFKVEKIVFGSESNDIDTLTTLAQIQLDNKDYNIIVKDLLDEGINYPTALSKALKQITKKEITEPNDILALSYIREIIKNKYNITPISIKRTNDYHDLKEDKNIISASNVRNKLLNKIDCKKYVPDITYKYLSRKKIFTLADYFPFLKYKIISSLDNLESYMTVDEGIENRIAKNIYKASNYNELIESVKTKRYTYNKISRMFCHILTDFKKKENTDKLESIKILGLSDNGKKYLNKIKKDIKIPIITKFSDYSNSERNHELKLSYIYSLLFNDALKDEYIKKEINSKIIFKNKNDWLVEYKFRL